jgi:hypothetical protein
MPFKNVLTLDGHYNGEEGTEGVRRGALGSLETLLLRQYKRSDEARTFGRTTQVASNLPASGSGRVRALAQFHTQQQGKSTAEEKANLEIVKLRQWLFRQHARIKPDGHIDWSRSVRKVEYDKEVRKQAMTRITVRGGLLVTADGRPFDTTKMVTMFSGPGAAIYVMSVTGDLHVSSHSVGYRHHSSLLAGGTVAGAGELCVRQGRIVWLSNKSGHYLPQPINLLQTIVQLSRAGYPGQYQVNCLYADRTTKSFPNILEFCKAHTFTDDVIGALDAVVAYVDSQGAYNGYNPYSVSPHVYAQYTASTARGPRAPSVPRTSDGSYVYSGGYQPYKPGYNAYKTTELPMGDYGVYKTTEFNVGDYNAYSSSGSSPSGSSGSYNQYSTSPFFAPSDYGVYRLSDEVGTGSYNAYAYTPVVPPGSTPPGSYAYNGSYTTSSSSSSSSATSTSAGYGAYSVSPL